MCANGKYGKILIQSSVSRCFDDSSARFFPSRRTAFTLGELLVVMAVIGVLVGLLLPAVQSARENARRLQCANNLKQIGVAIGNYESANGTLPPGNFAKTWGVCPGTHPIVDSTDSEDRANWLILLLPYLEQNGLSKDYQAQTANEDAKNQPLRETAVSAYLCPSDPNANRLQIPALGPAAADALNVPYRPGSYRAMAGRSDGEVFLDGGYFTGFPRRYRGPIHVVGIANFTAEKYKNIRDGASQTFMAGESITRSNPGFRTLWAYSYAFYGLSSATPQARVLWGDYDCCQAAEGDGWSFPCRRGWGSAHRGGINFLMCDGSVHFIATSIDMDLFAQLATIDGGETVQLPE
jgi:prepilin-type processing-associated H-X9-DG protein